MRHLSMLAAMTAVLFASPVAAQPDNGAFFNEQVRRNQSNGIGSLPSAVQPPLIRGPGAFYNDEVRQQQEGRGRVTPTLPSGGVNTDPYAGYSRPSTAPSASIPSSSGSLSGTAVRRTPRRQ